MNLDAAILRSAAGAGSRGQGQRARCAGRVQHGVQLGGVGLRLAGRARATARAAARAAVGGCAVAGLREVAGRCVAGQRHPGEDQRDWDFAEAFGLPIIRTVSPPPDWEGKAYTGEGPAINSAWLNGLYKAELIYREIWESLGEEVRITRERGAVDA